MSRIITAIISFKNESFVYEWVNKFNSKSADRKQFELNIKPISRDITKDNNTQKIIFIEQALGQNIQKFLKLNSEWTKYHKVDFFTME